MSGRELTRVEVLSRVKAGTLSLGSAAMLLAVSDRQAKRLARRYWAEGAKGLKHRSAGGPSNHARPAAAGAQGAFRRARATRWPFPLVVREAGAARLLDEPGRRCDRSNAGAARGRGNDLGGG